MMQPHYNLVAGQSRERLAGISDGVFAVAMTLLVLDLKLPAHGGLRDEAALRQMLLDLAPGLVVWLMSFMTLGIFWVGQQTQLNMLTRSSRGLTWLHLAFLAGVSIMPFSTTLMADHIGLRTALLVYWGNILVLGSLLLIAWRTARAAGLVSDTEMIRTHAIERRILIAQALYAVGAGLCLIDTFWSIGFIVMVQLNYVFAPRVLWLDRI